MIDRTVPTGNAHDFDFLYGNWTVQNRRLKQRLADHREWDDFAATFRCEPRLGGLVNVDEMQCPTAGFSGMTTRLFDAETRRWSIYWISSHRAVLSPPVTGGFDGDRGTFYGDDTHEGRPIEVEFVWSRLGPDRARWQQSFSLDGKTWETNWVMEFTRVADETR